MHGSSSEPAAVCGQRLIRARSLVTCSQVWEYFACPFPGGGLLPARLTSRQPDRAPQGQMDGPGKAGLAPQRSDSEGTAAARAARPHSHRGVGSRPRGEAPTQPPGRRLSPGRGGPTLRPVQRLVPRAAQRSRRRVGVPSSQRGSRPGAPKPAGRSHTRFIHCRRPSTRAQLSAKRKRRSRLCRCRARAPGWAPGRRMGSGRDKGLLPTQGQDADHPDHAGAAPPAAAPQGGQPPSVGQGPFFYIGGTNGAAIISAYCTGKGWRRTQDRCADYKLKWCEVKHRDSYCSFREGEQLLFQLPNNKLLTTKIGLLSALRECARVSSKVHQPGPGSQARALKMEDFFPETYRLDVREERQAFFSLFDETQVWICKPTASNQGRGIFLLRSQDDVATLQAKAQSGEEDASSRKMPFRVPQARVVQRYIQNPLLLDGKKFDVRAYLLIACAVPHMVFFGHGYARLTLSLYDPDSSDLSGHLTNQFMQKKSPLYLLLKEDTVWSMDHLNHYINSKFSKTPGLPRDWVLTTFTRMQQIMAHCFLAVKSKLECKLGYFDLIGCDFLVDENFKVWLLEMNSNPALHTNCQVLKEVIPEVVAETLDLALETFQKSLLGHKMLPLRSQRRFVLLHSGEADPRPRGSRPLPRAPPRGLDGAPGGESGTPGAERPRGDSGDPARGAAEAEREGRKRASPRGS
ncbi:inactive polyglycylase TTLL10 isoform X2 [Oryctolagus cuniculus]|uniref:inactive polyglycylase TTLL10 isoform X2 n=1 Tax=Oryctolagus cuniculus TaxID=9986 RepID=UPI0022316FF9|nr:inactive polyglycylase TTLL10 isoform X2 [Oryctolagus cuniculus]